MSPVVLLVVWQDRHAVLPTGIRVCAGSGTDQANELGPARLPESSAATAYAARSPAVCGTCLRGLLWFFRASDVVAGVERWRKSMGTIGE
jgi:hypothetical protein